MHLQLRSGACRPVSEFRLTFCLVSSMAWAELSTESTEVRLRERINGKSSCIAKHVKHVLPFTITGKKLPVFSLVYKKPCFLP